MKETTTPAISGRYLPGLPQVARAYLWARAAEPTVLVAPEDRVRLYADLEAFGRGVWVNPGLEAYGFAHRVLLDQAAALRPFPRDPEAWRVVFREGERILRDRLLDKLEKLGYRRDEPGGYTVRGEVLEVADLRLEFFGDTIETLFVGGERRSRAVLTPASGRAPEATVAALAAFEGTVFLDRPATLPDEAWPLLAQREVVAFGLGGPERPVERPPFEPLAPYRARLDRFAADVRGWLEAGFRVVLFYRHDRTRAYLSERYLADLPLATLRTVEERPGVQLVPAPFEGGFVHREERTVYLTEPLLFAFGGAAHARSRRVLQAAPEDPGALAVGDYLVHPEHGIGRFEGLESREVLGAVRDYLVLRYAGEGQLYVPVEQLPLLRRHPGTSDEPPRLSSLGRKDWQRAKARAQADAEALAQRLLVLYAKRQQAPGTAYPALPDWDPLIEAGFPHELTEDQARALEDVLRDLETPHPMDRLVSGDVGFGKTEIALRAAHRVVGHGRQVAYLAPTTLLAEQHYRTFAERYAELPVSVALLSRFTPEAEARRIEAGLAEGRIDVVIGTHRLLSERVRFKQLGLLIVDEEHRFGVAQKERIKEMAEGLDVLSLSATPIPRTLYQALVGLKDVSSIQTPPPGRKPIQTVVAPFDPALVREAVLFEMERGGKAFYVHDRIASIEARARYLEALLPEARIGVVHGRMADREIEEVMRHFARGAFDLLVATTIVESGLDIPEANTILIERADRLGLASLYQLRGRVGRREREAYAYLFHPPRLTEAAERRLAALADLTDLGSGHRLAEKDMEIRGVGNLLGPEQHGHVQAVSFEVYTELLAEAIRKLKGEEVQKPGHTTLDLAVSARIPPAYVPDAGERSRLYGRLAEARGLAELARIVREVRARYGEPPQEAAAFFALARLRILAEQKGVRSITEDDAHLQLVVGSWPLDYDARALRELPFVVEPTRYPPGFRVRKRGLAPADYPEALQRVLYALG
ncbi:transcription-repair coupling factor [Oceanithermus sp.]|uniref:transcription-repair coupling factor n=1 Tax=Oceanithermus sp. TaxID=2268145 RepID=UPI00257E1872|nr:transcription-repair coupling factor [Oceanithermus sp.]